MNWTSPKGHPLANYCRLVTNDLDEAREHVSRMWEHHRSHLKRGRTYGLRWHQANLKNTSLNYACSPSRIHVECASLGDYYRISMPESGRLYHRIDGKDVVSTATCAVLHAPGQELNLDTEPFARLQLSFDGSFVRKFLSQRFEKCPLSRNGRAPFLLRHRLVLPCVNCAAGRATSLIALERILSPRAVPPPAWSERC